jgi:hypothetical protein
LADTIAVCAMFKNEAPYILEWIAYHRLVGIDHFVLYDNASTDGGADLIARSGFARWVTLIDWPQRAGQIPAYSHFISNHARNFAWAAFIDLDEFVHPLEADSIPALLPRYEGFAGILLHWLVFGSSGHVARPPGLVLENYLYRVQVNAPVNGHVKSLVRTARIRAAHTNPHFVQLDGDYCNARGVPVPARALHSQACHEVMVVNHYFTKSAADWRAKVARGKADHFLATEAPYTDQPFRDVDHAARVEDRRITRFAPLVRRMLLEAQPHAVVQRPPAAQPAQRPLQLGIGIVTYNRKDILADTLDHIMRHTKFPTSAVVVADDGSTDGTLDMLRARQVPTVAGRNMGIAWNKNRVLFALTELLRCDIVILLEDDSYPVRDNWEREWMDAALRWGHVNIAGEWLRSYFVSGAGTAADPILSIRLTAQCAVFSREAILFGGYFDSRFRGYGHEHVEHSRRMVRMGYGGRDQPVEGQLTTLYSLIWGGIEFHPMRNSWFNADEAERNLQLAQQVMMEQTYRAPWQNEIEARQFRDEMRGAFPRPLL